MSSHSATIESTGKKSLKQDRYEHPDFYALDDLLTERMTTGWRHAETVRPSCWKAQASVATSRASAPLETRACRYRLAASKTPPLRWAAVELSSDGCATCCCLQTIRMFQWLAQRFPRRPPNFSYSARHFSWQLAAVEVEVRPHRPPQPQRQPTLKCWCCQTPPTFPAQAFRGTVGLQAR